VTLPERAETLAVRLARTGFVDGSRAQETLATLGFADGAADAAFIASLAAVADPDLALTSLARIVDAMTQLERHDFLAAIREREGLRIRLLAVLGASRAARRLPPVAAFACGSRSRRRRRG
jgi:glutamate-ammonia-ligase adenylyltransferase